MRARGFVPHFFPGGGVLFALFAIALTALVVFLFWRILHKAGFEGAMSLLILVPLVNIGLIAYLAFADWPALLEHRRLAYARTAVPEVPVAATPPEEADTVIVPTAPMGEKSAVVPAEEPPSADAPTEPLKRARKDSSAD